MNRGPDSGHKKSQDVFRKSRGVTPVSWPNLPIGLCPSWPPNHPCILIGFITVSNPPVSWCVVGVLAQYGYRRIIQVDAAHWWWLRRIPFPYVKRFEVPEKAVYKCNKLLLLLCIGTVLGPQKMMFDKNTRTQVQTRTQIEKGP